MANEYYRFVSNRGATFDVTAGALCDTATARAADVEIAVKVASAMKTDEIIAAIDRLKAKITTVDPKYTT